MIRRGLVSAAFIAAVCLLITGASLVRAQDTPQAPMFTTATDLVLLHVNVFDGRSDAVENLPRAAFTIVDDDRPQEITFFRNEEVPVAVGLVIDNSGSMIARRGMVLAGAEAFADSSLPEDELFTVIFNEHVRYGLPNGVAFTRSRQQLLSALARFPAGGKTALYDAVIDGLRHLAAAPLRKKALIVLSDGEDNASSRSKDQMLEAARASDSLIYTVARRDMGSGAGGDPGVMRRLAEATGGVAYFPRRDMDVAASFAEIAGNLRRGYSIGYVPATSGDGKYHRIKVDVRVPGRRLTAHARHGYTSPRPDGAQ